MTSSSADRRFTVGVFVTPAELDLLILSMTVAGSYGAPERREQRLELTGLLREVRETNKFMIKAVEASLAKSA